MLAASEPEITHRFTFNLEGDHIAVEVSDTSSYYRWRLIVNDSESEWGTSSHNLIIHDGYGVASSYWSGHLEAMIPFNITYCK